MPCSESQASHRSGLALWYVLNGWTRSDMTRMQGIPHRVTSISLVAVMRCASMSDGVKSLGKDYRMSCPNFRRFKLSFDLSTLSRVDGLGVGSNLTTYP